MAETRQDPVPSLAPGARAGGYVVEQRLGFGGFGEVYRARDAVIDRVVAIKVLHARYSHDAESVARFISEARAVNQISHAGIVEVFAFGRLEDGREYFVMELLEGRTLRALLAERRRLPLAEAVPILRGIAEAVDAAHAAGIAHRDLKPDNIFILPDGRTKLIDFGLAKLTREAATATADGTVFGSPQYMSPEQCRGKAIDTRTDLYSFGALAYHLLAGEPPFTGEALEVALHHLNDRPAPPSQHLVLPRNVDRVVLALLAKDPTDRPQPLASVVDALAGSSTLRLRRTRLVKRVAAAAVPLGLTALGIVRFADGGEAIARTCPAGLDRVGAIWNAETRATLEQRFASVAREDVPIAWRNTRVMLDDTSVRWATRWDEACDAPDRATDPLLYGQRVACLESALFDLDRQVDVLHVVDIDAYAKFFDGTPFGTGMRTLDDCASPAVLRAQLPAVAPEVRERILAVQRQSSRVEIAAWQAHWQRDTSAVVEHANRLLPIAKELESLDPPSAAPTILARAALLVTIARDVDANRRIEARAALDDAIERFERSRDDIALAHAHLAATAFAFSAAEPITAIAVGLDRARKSVVRAGHPQRATRLLAQLQGELAMRRGDFDDAIAAYREALHLAGTDLPSQRWAWMGLVVTLARSGHSAEAIAEGKRWLVAEEAKFGSTHFALSNAIGYLAMLHEIGGDLRASLELRHRFERLRSAVQAENERRSPWGRIYMLELELRLGERAPDAGAAIAAIAGLGTTPPRQNPDAAATTRRAGMLATFAYAVDHGVASPDAIDEHRAVLAFHRNDRAAMATHARLVVDRCRQRSCNDWIRTARWLALLDETSSAVVDDQLATLEREYEHDPAAIAQSGIALAHLGRWADAQQKLEAARALPGWEYQSDLAELDAWLGLARLRAGDVANARLVLEESLFILSIWSNGIDGWSYTQPAVELALADLLWSSDRNGERARARWLATRARDGYARLGEHRSAERRAAENWLETHR